MKVKIALLTVSDSRGPDEDTSGDYLAQAAKDAGHKVVERAILPDDKYRLRALVSQWIASDAVQIIISTGGTGFTGRDSTPEAVRPLLDKEMPGFGEMFRVLSFDDIGTSTLQSRVFAGVANGTFIFCLPGSTNACRTGWEKLIRDQLDIDNRPLQSGRIVSETTRALVLTSPCGRGRERSGRVRGGANPGSLTPALPQREREKSASAR